MPPGPALTSRLIVATLLGTRPLWAAEEPGDEIADARNIQKGWPIPDEGYCDQPYVVITDDGQWLCVMTTGRGVEGQAGQHIVSTRSADRGRTWSEHVAIEPDNGPEASWVMPLKVPGGRVYVFYTYNARQPPRRARRATRPRRISASTRWATTASSTPTTTAVPGRASASRSRCER